MRPVLTALCLAVLAAPAHAATVDLGGHGTLSITLPAGWTVSSQPAGDSGVAVSLLPPHGVNARCFISVSFLADPRMLTKDEVDAKLKVVSEQFVDQSVEKKQVIQSLGLSGGAVGDYCTFTDASLVGKTAGPDDFKVVGIGVIAYSDQFAAAVSLAAQDLKGQDFADMLAAVRSTSVSRK